MQDLEAFGIAVAGIARDLQDENAALRARVATLDAQLAAVTPWEIVGRVPTDDEITAAAVHDSEDGSYACMMAIVNGKLRGLRWVPGDAFPLRNVDLITALNHYPDTVFIPMGVDGRPLPKPSHIP